jgi:hypothetical protein
LPPTLRLVTSVEVEREQLEIYRKTINQWVIEGFDGKRKRPKRSIIEGGVERVERGKVGDKGYNFICYKLLR